MGRESLLRNPDAFWDHVLEGDKPALASALERAAQSGQSLRHDFRIRHAQGETRWIRSSASVREERDGSFLWNGSWDDITWQKATERAAQEVHMDGRYRGLLEAAPDAMVVVNQDGEIVLLNVQAEKQFGYHRDELVGQKVKNIIPEGFAERLIADGTRTAAEALAQQIGTGIELSGRRKDGSEFPIEIMLSPLLSTEGILVTAAIRDISVRKDAEQQKAAAELVARVDGQDRVRFSVKDTGIGISLENQARLFQPFVQAAGDTPPRSGGSGLGLTICKRLAEMMGGSVEMVSEPGAGTTMILELSLPIADPKAVAKVDPVSAEDWLSTTMRTRRMAPDSAQAESEGTLVLLADDHPTNRSLLARQVNMLGYAAETAENGIEALAKWRSGRFGIVITDCNMPHMNGYELTRSIRELESANGRKRIPVIACTANVLGGEAEACLDAGMDDYLAKPVDLKDLTKKLNRWLPIAQPDAPVDRAVLAAISGGDAAAELEMLSDFQRVNDQDVVVLKLALKMCKIPEVTNASHRIKGASRTVGAIALAAVCERLERAGRASDWGGRSRRTWERSSAS